jgi:hypothetical protein
MFTSASPGCRFFVPLRLGELIGEGVALFFDGTESFSYRKLSGSVTSINPSFERLNLGVFGSGGSLQFAGEPGFRQLDGGELIFLG